jgi:hypothetical protein
MENSRARLLGLIALGALGLSATPAPAQSGTELADSLARMVGTLNVSSQPVMSEGQLTGCTLVFDALYRDFTYRNGGFLRVSGNVGLMTGQNNLGTALKVVVLELDPSKPDMGMNPSAPSRAYLQGSNLKTNLSSLVQSTASDTPGALFSIFELSPTVEFVLEALQENFLTIAFNSMGGNSDIRLAIELDVVDFEADGSRIRSDRTKTEFTNCVVTLLEDSQ